MKLNNKGFAITSVLYGLLILFVILVGSYLTILVAKKNRLDTISEEINEKYGFNTCLNKNANSDCTEIESDSPVISCNGSYTADYTGKYIFKDKKSESQCVTYLEKGKTYENTESMRFTDSEKCSYNCSSATGDLYLIQVYYNGDETDE